MEKIRILLVDDDRQNSEFLQKFLEVEGYEVTYAENGRKGWEAFSAAKPDLVLLDVNMPVMNGFELARLIREQDRDVLIFFLTDRTEKADRLKGFDLKGNDYIPKPFYPEELIAKIKERFEHRQSTLSSFITIGQTIFDRNLSTIEINGTVQHLSARQSEILTILAENIGQTVERDTVLQSVWGNDNYANSLALNIQITYLRKLLKADTSISIVSLNFCINSTISSCQPCFEPANGAKINIQTLVSKKNSSVGLTVYFDILYVAIYRVVHYFVKLFLVSIERLGVGSHFLNTRCRLVIDI